MYVYSYEQLLAIVNQQATTITRQVAVINNLRTEREWLEEDNKLQREEVEKTTKKIRDQDKIAKLKEKKLKKEMLQVKESQEQIKRKHQSAVRELNDLKGRNLKIKAHCTSLLDKLDQSSQELQQNKEELDRVNQELDSGYSLGESMYQHLRYYHWWYFELLKYFQRPGPPTGGATITELDTTPHVTKGVQVLPKPTSETVIAPAPVNTVKETETDYRTTLRVAQNVIQSFRRNTICSQTAYILSHTPSRDLSPIEFLLLNNNSCSFIFEAPEVPQLLALESEGHTRSGNHVHPQLLAICPPEWAKAENKFKIPRAVKAGNRTPRIRTNTTLTNITSCNNTFGSPPKNSKEKHESRSEPPNVGHCQPTTVSSEHRLDSNNPSTDGQKEFLTRKDESRQSGEKKPKALVSWLKNYRYSAKLNWSKMVSVPIN